MHSKNSEGKEGGGEGKEGEGEMEEDFDLRAFAKLLEETAGLGLGEATLPLQQMEDLAVGTELEQEADRAGRFEVAIQANDVAMGELRLDFHFTSDIVTALFRGDHLPFDLQKK